MKNSKELKELRSDLISELESIKVLAETETRDLTKKENEKVDTLLANIDDNDVAITRSEKIENSLKIAAASSGAVVTPVDTDKATRSWSLFKAVNEIRKGGLTGVEAEMHQEAEKENRGQLEGIGLPAFMTEKRASPITQAGSLIAPSVTNAFVEELLEASLWNRVGLTNLGNLSAKRDWGHAKDYVEAQWMILQHDDPDDFVIATGKQYSVKDFVNSVANYLGIEILWSGEGESEIGTVKSVSGKSESLKYWIDKPLIKVDPRYFRPAEVETLLGDASKAKKILGWEPKISFDELVSEMIESDIDQLKISTNTF